MLFVHKSFVRFQTSFKVDDDILIYYVIKIPFCSQLHHFAPDYGQWVWHPSSGSENSQKQNYKKESLGIKRIKFKFYPYHQCKNIAYSLGY